MRTLSSLLRRFSTALAALAFCCAPALATDYYVDLGAGNDAGAGTIGDPWRTLTHAMVAVQPDQGHRVLVRGVANTSSPGETFPIRIRGGISLSTWSAQEGATIDAGASTCLEIAMPASTNQSFNGAAQNLVIAGHPAISVSVVALTDTANLVVEDCRLIGDLSMTLAPTPTPRSLLSSIVVRDCLIEGDLRLLQHSNYQVGGRNTFFAALFDSDIRGAVTVLRLEAAAHHLEFRGNRVGGDFTFDTSFASRLSVVDNILSSGSLEVGGLAASRVYGNPTVVQGNRTPGDLSVDANGPLQVLGNRAGGGIDVHDYELSVFHDNVAGGLLDITQVLVGLGVSTGSLTVLRNDGAGMRIEMEANPTPLLIAENTLRGTLQFGLLPHAAIEIRANRITCSGGAHGIRFATASAPWRVGLPMVTLQENDIRAATPSGAAIRLDGYRGTFECVANRIEGFATGVAMPSTIVMEGTATGQGFRFERNHFRGNAVGLDLDLWSAREDLRFIANVVEGGTRGLVLSRGNYAGTIRMWNNIFAFHTGPDVTAAFAAIDRVQWNLAAGGSLLARDLTNISGDPHFADRAAGDVSLLPSSPAVGSGVDAQTLELGFNMGLDALAPSATLSFRTPSPSTGSLRFAQPSATAALMLFAFAPAYPASLALCEGRVGLDPTTWFATLPVALQGGAATIGFALPSGPWTVAVQALSDGGAGVPPCRLSNTVIARR